MHPQVAHETLDAGPRDDLTQRHRVAVGLPQSLENPGGDPDLEQVVAANMRRL